MRGWAVGLGCNLALAADFTVADDGATFWEPFLARGFTPDSGSTWLLPRLAGVARAKRMLLLGEKVSGSRCRRLGADPQRGRPSDELDAAADALVARLAGGPTVAIGLAKQAISYGQHATLSAVDEPGTVQSRTLLPHRRFQRGSGRVPGTARPGLQVEQSASLKGNWPMPARPSTHQV